nr:hypothetical protein [Tanacetum cinerariifolium]
MGEPTMEEYMTKTREGYVSGIARNKINENDHFELKGQFIKELCVNTFSGSDNGDANEYFEKVLEVIDLFHIPKITQDQVVLRVFPMSLTGAASRWLRNELAGLIKTWETLKEKVLSKYCLLGQTAKKIKEINNFQQDPNETLYQGLDVPIRQILYYKCVIPFMKADDAKKAIQDMADHSQKWHNETPTRCRSTKTSNGLAAIQAQLNILGEEIKKVNEKVYDAQVGCELCKGSHYTKDYRYAISGPLNSKLFFMPSQVTIPFLSLLYDDCYDEEEGSYGLKDLDAYSIETTLFYDALPPKEKDPGSFTLPCYINNLCFNKALANLGASVSVMPFSTYTYLGLDPTIEEGEVVDEPMMDIVKTRSDDEIINGLDEFLSYCDFDRTIHIDNMMGEVDIETLTIEQYIMLTHGNQASSMVKPKFGMKEKDIEDMTITEYMKHELEMKRQSRRNVIPYFPTNHEDTDICFFYHNKRKVLDYPHHSYDSKTSVYYDLPTLIPCFKHVQLPTICRHKLLKEDTDYISKDESKMGDQKLINHTELKRHICRHDKEGKDDALITILKSLVGECKAVHANKGGILRALPCQLPPKELNPGSFTLPCTISSLTLYVVEDLGASVNIMSRSIFEHLRLAILKETDRREFPLQVKVVPTAKRLEMPLSGVCTAIEEMMKKLPVKDRWQIHMINELVKYQDHYAKVLKYQSQQRMPPSKKQQREFYMSVLKSHSGWKTKHFKGMTLDEIKEKFIPVWKQIEDFVPMGSKEE